MFLLALFMGTTTLFFAFTQQDVIFEPSGKCVGTDPRWEYEYKLALDSTGNQLNSISKIIFKKLSEKLDHMDWSAPQAIGKKYFVKENPHVLVMRDLYLDTSQGKLLQNASSYRLRHRFRSSHDQKSHEKYPEKAQYFPIRFEIQSKRAKVALG